MLKGMRSHVIFMVGLVLGGCGGGGGSGTDGATAPPEDTPPLKLQFEVVASGLDSPTFLASPPGGTDIYIVEQPGRIRKLASGVPKAPVLDISARVSSGGERGMLSLAFDPQFTTNGNVFVYFTDPNGDIAIERFTFPVTGGVAPPIGTESTAVRVLTIPHHTFANHNGGQLQFGLDGMLYVGTGDGGGGGDTLGSGQNLDTLLGKILRVDVSSLPYTVPPDNPFVGQPGKRPEIWAFGVRNPWRFSFDATTRSLYIADVGQGNREEVDVVAASAGDSTMDGISGKAPVAIRRAPRAIRRASRCHSSTTATVTVAPSRVGTCIVVPRSRKLPGATSTPTSAAAGFEVFSSRTRARPSEPTGASPPWGTSNRSASIQGRSFTH